MSHTSPPCDNHAPELDDRLLERIFWLVCTAPTLENNEDSDNVILANRASRVRHVPALPLVCRRWSYVYTNSGLLWTDVHLDWKTALGQTAKHANKPHADHPPANTDAVSLVAFVSRWLFARAPLFVGLTYSSCWILGSALKLEQHVATLCRSAPRLRCLSLLDVSGCVDEELFAAARAAANLERFALRWYQPKENLRQTPLLSISTSTLASLGGGASRPQAKKRGLQHLQICIDRITGNVVPPHHHQAANTLASPTWSEFEHLTHLCFAGRIESLVMPPELLLSLHHLRQLELSNVRLPQLSPSMVSALGGVSRLTLESVLAAKPRRKSGFMLWDALPGLKSLRFLSINAAGREARLPGSALACSALQGLTLLSSNHVSNWPGGVQEGNETVLSRASLLNAKYPSLATLEQLHVEDVGLGSNSPPQLFWQQLQGLTSLTWRCVRRLPPRHRPWEWRGLRDTGSLPVPCTSRTLCKLRELRLEYVGMSQWRLEFLVALLAECEGLQMLGLEGNVGLEERLDFIIGIGLYTKRLERLYLRNCGLTQLTGKLLCVGPASPGSTRVLDLRDNPGLEIEDDFEKRLADAQWVVLRNDRQSLMKGWAEGTTGVAG